MAANEIRTEMPRRRGAGVVAILGLAGLFLLAAPFAAPFASAHGGGAELFERAEKVIMPFADQTPSVDGTVQAGEYSEYGHWQEEGFHVYLAHNDSAIFVGLQQPGQGWAGIALSDDVDAGANVLVATENATSSQILDGFAANVTDEMTFVPDADVGGTDDVLAFGASMSTGAQYEFAIPLDSEDLRDQRLEVGELYPLVVAYNETARDIPGALADGDIHFLQVYVARATDDLAAIQEVFMGNPSPVPALAAMAVFSVALGALVWRYALPRREADR